MADFFYLMHIIGSEKLDSLDILPKNSSNARQSGSTWLSQARNRARNSSKIVPGRLEEAALFRRCLIVRESHRIYWWPMRCITWGCFQIAPGASTIYLCTSPAELAPACERHSNWVEFNFSFSYAQDASMKFSFLTFTPPSVLVVDHASCPTLRFLRFLSLSLSMPFITTSHIQATAGRITELYNQPSSSQYLIRYGLLM